MLNKYKGEKMDFRVLESDSDNIEDVTPEIASISEIKNFTDNEGRTVMGSYPIDNPDNHSFTGLFMVSTSMGPVRLQIEFPEGFTIQECFEQFDNFAQQTVEKVQEETNERNRIVTPNQMRGKSQNIVIPR